MSSESHIMRCLCRGGGEYGKEWWEHGHLLEKQNSFDDFASCLQYLQDAKWTSPAKTTIQVCFGRQAN